MGRDGKSSTIKFANWKIGRWIWGDCVAQTVFFISVVVKVTLKKAGVG